MLTALEKKETSEPTDKTTDTDDNPLDSRGDTALSRNSDVSDGKDNALSADKQEEEGNRRSDGRGSNGKPGTHIDDFGEKILGARKDELSGFVRTIENVTEQSLIELPLSKAFKRPNLKRMVDNGVIGEDEAMLASCREANVDPRQWLEHVLVKIPARKKSGLPMDDLLPLEYAKKPNVRPWNLPNPD